MSEPKTSLTIEISQAEENPAEKNLQETQDAQLQEQPDLQKQQKLSPYKDIFEKEEENPKPQDAGPEAEIRYGKCKWFNVAKGWGFITPNDGGQEVFVHQSVIQMSGFRSLAEQEEVEYECKETERGLEATRVSGINKLDCHGSTFRPRQKRRFRRVRCYNCGEFANHIAAKCDQGPQPKRCHFCKAEDHLFQNCPNRPTTSGTNSRASSRASSSNC